MPLKLLLMTPSLEKIIEPLYDQPKFVRPSLAHISGYVRKNSDCQIRCVDAKFEQKNAEKLIAEIRNFNPAVVGISAYTYEMEETNLLVKKIKEFFPELLLILGGSHVSALPQETLKDIPEIDIGIIGEGEKTMLEICKSFSEKKDISKIPGIVFRNAQGNIVMNERAGFEDLKNFPMPAWDLLPKAEEYFVQTARGCPFKCNFCLNPNGNIIRTRLVEDIIEEISFLIEEFKPKRISFGDEAFGANKEMTHRLLDRMIALDIGGKTNWDVQTHVKFIDDELVLKMKRAKVKKVAMGVESGNDQILKKMGKMIDKKEALAAFAKLKKHKVKSAAFFIFGHPDESKKTIWETIRFAAKINPTEPIFAIMVPFPGTKIVEYARKKEKGYLSPSKNWSTYRKQINDALEVSGISKRRLKLYLLFANVYIFAYNLRFLDLIKFSFHYRKSALSFLKNICGI